MEPLPPVFTSKSKPVALGANPLVAWPDAMSIFSLLRLNARPMRVNEARLHHANACDQAKSERFNHTILLLLSLLLFSGALLLQLFFGAQFFSILIVLAIIFFVYHAFMFSAWDKRASLYSPARLETLEALNQVKAFVAHEMRMLAAAQSGVLLEGQCLEAIALGKARQISDYRQRLVDDFNTLSGPASHRVEPPPSK